MARQLATIEQLMTFLQKSNFIKVSGKYPKHQPCTSTDEVSEKISFGHAGTLFRRNLIQEWWMEMVVRQASVFVIEDTSLHDYSSQINHSDEHGSTVSQVGLGHFPHNLELNHRRLPLSIVQVATTGHMASEHDVAFTRNSHKCLLLSQQFVAPSASEKAFDKCHRSRLRWWKQFSSNGSKFITDLNKFPEGSSEMRIQYQAPWGPVTMETVTNLGESAIKRLEQTTGELCQVKHERKNVTPCVIESETTLEQAMLALMVDAYDQPTPTIVDELTDKTNTRSVLSLHHRLSPYKASIAVSKFSASLKDLRTIANHMVKELRLAGVPVLDPPENSNLESTYALCDQLGIPFTVTIRESTLNDGIVHIRNRDTTLSEKVHITHLKNNIIRAIRSA